MNTRYFCEECQSFECTRNHESGRRKGSGKQHDHQICLFCQQRRVLYQIDGVEKCAECAGIRKKKQLKKCGVCSTDSIIILIRSDGIQVGSCCYHTPIEKCVECGEMGSVYFRKRGVDAVCLGCYNEIYCPRATCSRCFKEDVLIQGYEDKAKTRPYCRACYRRPLTNCFKCSKEKIIAAGHEDKAKIRPYCYACYIQYLAPRFYCIDCGELRVSKKKIKDTEGNVIGRQCNLCYSREYRRKKKAEKEKLNTL